MCNSYTDSVHERAASCNLLGNRPGLQIKVSTSNNRIIWCTDNDVDCLQEGFPRCIYLECSCFVICCYLYLNLCTNYYHNTLYKCSIYCLFQNCELAVRAPLLLMIVFVFLIFRFYYFNYFEV